MYLATAKHNCSITQIEYVTVGNAELDINVEDVALPNVINNVNVIAVDMLSASDGFLQCGCTVTPTEGEECECQKCGLLSAMQGGMQT